MIKIGDYLEYPVFYQKGIKFKEDGSMILPTNKDVVTKMLPAIVVDTFGNTYILCVLKLDNTIEQFAVTIEDIEEKAKLITDYKFRECDPNKNYLAMWYLSMAYGGYKIEKENHADI